MSGIVTKALLAGTFAFAATTSFATAASAQDQKTPKGWSYEIKDGKRVPKGHRVTNPDGSWREEIRQGKCVTIKERSAKGEYKETRQCDPAKPN
jgi:Spy/CpxP family protein refolding chaperone